MKQKQFHCGYLYADGHAVIVYTKQDCDAGEIQFCELHQKYTEAHLSFEGRLVLTTFALLRLAKQAKCIRAEEPSVTHGSDASKKLGVKVGHLAFEMGEAYRDTLYFYDFPGLLSGQHTYQPDLGELWADVADKCHWGNCRISKCHRIPAPPVAEAVAA